MISILKTIPKINYLSKKYYFIAMSVVFSILSILSLTFRGLNLGLDFRGGTQIQLKFNQSISLGEIRSLLETELGTSISLTRIGNIEQENYLLSFRQLTGEKAKMDIQETVHQILGKKNITATIQRAETIGPKIGAELRQNAFYAILISLGLILAYTAVRFNFPFGVGAVVSLFHDTLVTVGAFSLFQIEFDLTALAGVLTLIGYSMNDTIVVFDRVRENIKKHPGKTLFENVNLSVNETMSRTILTFFTTFIIVVAMFLFGGPSIQGFSFAFLVGLVVGTYSSVFIASPVAIWIQNYLNKKSTSKKEKA